MKSFAALSLTFVLISPLAGFAAENWAEKVFPNPKDCALSDGSSISYDVDEKKIIVRGKFPRDVRDSLTSIGKTVSGKCKPNDSSGLSIAIGGQFFGGEYKSFTVPIYGSGEAGCMSDYYYSFTFDQRADVLHDNILKRTGKNLKVVPATGSTSSVEDPGWITDFGNHAVYTCSMIGY